MVTITRMDAATRLKDHRALDPRTLGRPVHLLSRFTERVHRELNGIFQARINRRYGARFEITRVSVERAAHGRFAEDSRRWLTFAVGEHPVAFAIDRSILLCLLGYRYGSLPVSDPAAPPEPMADTAAVPETATEERLAGSLGRQLLAAIGASLEALETGHAGPRPSAYQRPPDNESVPAPQHPPAIPKDAWILAANILEHDGRLEGTLWFQLDEAWMSRLLRALAPARRRAALPDPAALPAHLRLTLTARLIEKPITLGALLDLRVGDVIPTTLGNADVLIDDSRLFTASIAEHKGKLCLTSFEDME